jgi:hypothetical protein
LENELKERQDEKKEEFKQAVLGAFPHMYEKLYGDEKEADEEVEQFVPTTAEEFQDLDQILTAIFEGGGITDG